MTNLMKNWLKLKFRTLMRFAESHTPEFARRGENVFIGSGLEVNRPDRVYLGGNIYIGPHATFNSLGSLRIQSGTVIGPYCHIYTANHYAKYDAEALPFDQRNELRPVDIGRNVWIGGDVVIAPGVTIGEGAIIGCGSVVVEDVKPLAMVGGLPAKVIRLRNEQRYRKLVDEGKILFQMHDVNKVVYEDLGCVPESWKTEEC